MSTVAVQAIYAQISLARPRVLRGKKLFKVGKEVSESENKIANHTDNPISSTFLLHNTIFNYSRFDNVCNQTGLRIMGKLDVGLEFIWTFFLFMGVLICREK